MRINSIWIRGVPLIKMFHISFFKWKYKLYDPLPFPLSSPSSIRSAPPFLCESSSMTHSCSWFFFFIVCLSKSFFGSRFQFPTSLLSTRWMSPRRWWDLQWPWMLKLAADLGSSPIPSFYRLPSRRLGGKSKKTPIWGAPLPKSHGI